MKNFDERQILIKSNIFKRMFWIMSILVLANGLLARFFDIIWADTYYSSVIIFFVVLAFGSIEMIFREVYYINLRQQKFIIVFGSCGLLLCILNVVHLIRGAEFISDGMLAEAGGSFIYSLLILSIGIGGAVKIIMDRVCRSGEEEE